MHGSELMNAEQFSQSKQPVLFCAVEGLVRTLLLLVNPEQAKLPVGTKVWLIGRSIGTISADSPQGHRETCLFAEALYVGKKE